MKIYEFNSFEEFERAEVAGEDEALTIVTENGWIKSDLVTVCKSWKTALRRFFKALSARHPEIAEWTESLTESAENGYFRMNDNMMADGTQNPFPSYAWDIEEVDDGVWYIFLNVRQDEDETPAEATENATETPAEAETTATTEQKQIAEIRRDMSGTLEALRAAEAREKAIRQDAAGMEACIKALRAENERLRALVAQLQH